MDSPVEVLDEALNASNEALRAQGETRFDR